MTPEQIQLRSIQRLVRVTDKRGVNSAKRIFEDAMAVLESKLHRASRGQSTLTVELYKSYMAQLQAAQEELTKSLISTTAAVTREAQIESREAFIDALEKSEEIAGGSLPVLALDEASQFFADREGRRTSLLGSQKDVFTLNEHDTMQRVRRELALSLASGQGTDETIGRVMDSIGGSWYRSERIVRTELAWAYNSAHADSIADAQEEIPDLMMRWVELVDDTTGAPYDDRVAPDSLAMHGQLAAPGSKFTMPNDPRVPATLWGKTYSSPPNRPNDRATLSPWRPHWGIPGWVWKDGQKVNVTEANAEQVLGNKERPEPPAPIGGEEDKSEKVKLPSVTKAQLGEIAPAPAPIVAPVFRSPSQGLRESGTTIRDENGKELSHEEADALLNQLFKKPDGTPVSYEDVSRIFPSPGGPFTITPKIQKRDSRDSAVTDAYGNPVFDVGSPVTVPHVDVKIDEIIIQRKKKGEGEHVSAKFNMAAVSGDTYLTDHFQRTFHKAPDGALSVEHNLLFFKEQYTGGGLGARMLRDMVTAYPKMGVSRIDVEAADIGKYTWARMGFDWGKAKHTGNAMRFGRYMGRFKKPDGTPYTMDETSKLFLSQKSASDAVQISLPVLGPDGVKMVPVAKNMFTSNEASGWEGHVDLKDGDPSYEHFKNYLGIIGDKK